MIAGERDVSSLQSLLVSTVGHKNWLLVGRMELVSADGELHVWNCADAEEKRQEERRQKTASRRKPKAEQKSSDVSPEKPAPRYVSMPVVGKHDRKKWQMASKALEWKGITHAVVKRKNRYHLVWQANASIHHTPYKLKRVILGVLESAGFREAADKGGYSPSFRNAEFIMGSFGGKSDFWKLKAGHSRP